MDPVTLAILAGSAVAGGVGGSLEASAAAKNNVAAIRASMTQAQQDANEARARNEVMRGYQERQAGWLNDNQGSFTGGLAPFLPDGQGAAMTSAADTRGSAISRAIDSAGPSNIAFRADAPSVAVDAANSSIADAFGRVHAQGRRTAGAGAYGDVWGGNSRTISGTARRVGTTNAISQGNIKLLPSEQDLVGFQQQPPVMQTAPVQAPWYAGALKALGSIGGSYAGSRMGGSGAPAPAKVRG